MDQLPPPYPMIRQLLERGDVIPFLGAGASLVSPPTRGASEHEQAQKSGPELPTGRKLALTLAEKTALPGGELLALAEVAQYFELVMSRDDLNEELHGVFAKDYPLPPLHRYLADVETTLLIVTTNYDDLMERAFRDGGRPFDLVIHTTDRDLGDRLLWWPYGAADPEEVVSNKLAIDLSTVSVIYKMHGAVDRRDPGRDQYVITENDYVEFLTRDARQRAIPSVFAEPFQKRHFLFLGYSLSDWNLRVVLNRAVKQLGKEHKNKSWAIRTQVTPLEKRLWQERGVETYDMSIDQFVEQLKSAKA